MHIPVVASKGTGSTLLSAFDNALQNAGIFNYNLIVLSSVIPPDSTILDTDKYITPPEEYGYRLYVVQSQERSDIIGEVIGAAIGYYQLPDGRGVFVEHHRRGTNENEVQEALWEDVQQTITDLCEARQFPIDEDAIKMKSSVATVEDKPMCVMVTAVYQSEPWA